MQMVPCSLLRGPGPPLIGVVASDRGLELDRNQVGGADPESARELPRPPPRPAPSGPGRRHGLQTTTGRTFQGPAWRLQAHTPAADWVHDGLAQVSLFRVFPCG